MVYVYGPFYKIEGEESLCDIMDERKHVNLVANGRGRALFLPFILENFLDFNI